MKNFIESQDLISKKKSKEDIPDEIEKYFKDLGVELSNVIRLGSGFDSDIFSVKSKEPGDNDRLVKIYGDILPEEKSEFRMVVLEKYLEMCGRARKIFEINNNPLNQTININGKEFKLEYSVASGGNLIEKNGIIGSWIDDPVLDDSTDMENFNESEKEELSAKVWKVGKNFLSSKFNRNIDLDKTNYKVFVDDKKKVVRIIYTDLAESITKFVETI